MYELPSPVYELNGFGIDGNRQTETAKGNSRKPHKGTVEYHKGKLCFEAIFTALEGIMGGLGTVENHKGVK